MLRRGAERGEVRPQAVTPVVASVGPLLVMSMFLLRGEPASEEALTEIVDQVMLPLMSQAPDQAGP